MKCFKKWPRRNDADRERYERAARTADRAVEQLGWLRHFAQQIEKSGRELRDTREKNHIGPAVVASFQPKRK